MTVNRPQRQATIFLKNLKCFLILELISLWIRKKRELPRNSNVLQIVNKDPVLDIVPVWLQKSTKIIGELQKYGGKKLVIELVSAR